MVYNTYFQLDSKQNPYLFTHILGDTGTIFHHHDFYEFVYIQEGKATNIVGNTQYSLCKGDFSLVVPGESHKIVPEKGCVRRDICIAAKVFEDLCNLVMPEKLLSIVSESDSVKKFSCPVHLSLLLEQKLDTFSGKPDKGDLESKLLVCSFLTEILLEIAPKDNAPSAKTMPEWLNTVILRFQHIEYIRQGISAIVKDVNYNQIYVNRIFKQYMGLSLRAYLTETKLNLSLIYLKTSNHSVTDISEILGFSSQSFFHKQFKNRFGITPSEYRAKNSSEERVVI
ncbi:MAG: AraC family transcriptional regulator [Candidatus Borkfalkiaceae bacterium]|nr:AraC family transcriptional regulator [Christensenellaceae bacterium]